MEKRLNQAMRTRRAGQRGFTLIELLVVIAVLAVLAAVVVFNVTGVKDKGSKAACATDVKSAQSAIDAYINDGSKAGALAAGNMTAAEWAFLVPSYIHTTPASCAVVMVLTADGNGGFTADSTSAH